MAVLPAGPGVDEVRAWPREIARELPGNTIAVISGRYFYAGSDEQYAAVRGVATDGLAAAARARSLLGHTGAEPSGAPAP